MFSFCCVCVFFFFIVIGIFCWWFWSWFLILMFLSLFVHLPFANWMIYSLLYSRNGSFHTCWTEYVYLLPWRRRSFGSCMQTCSSACLSAFLLVIFSSFYAFIVFTCLGIAMECYFVGWLIKSFYVCLFFSQGNQLLFFALRSLPCRVILSLDGGITYYPLLSVPPLLSLLSRRYLFFCYCCLFLSFYRILWAFISRLSWAV